MNHNGSPRTIVITGASAGVGRAVAREFGRERARIALLARGRDGLEAAKREVDELGGRGLVIPTDVADFDQVEAAAEQAERELGPIDVWVNNAMVSVFAPIEKITPDEFRRVTEVTYHGQVWGAMAALKRMKPRNRGKIIFVGSALAYRGIPLQSAYCGAKHATEGFYDSLRTELMHEQSNVKVTMVQLAAFNTPQFEWSRAKMPNKPRPMGTPYQPEVAARAVVWASNNDRRELYVGFPAAKAIIGNKIAPWYADHVLARDGYAGQQRDEPIGPDRRDNLFEPVPGDHGAHGVFDAEARTFSPQLWATTHRPWLAAAAAGVLALTAGVYRGLAEDDD
jgi:NAD(P)-dependent dehydrogenase (short-subunit alcohol dehydrogenase family)